MNQSTYNALKSFIWGIANDCLVDVYDVGDYRKVILPMLVIRRLMRFWNRSMMKW